MQNVEYGLSFADKISGNNSLANLHDNDLCSSINAFDGFLYQKKNRML